MGKFTGIFLRRRIKKFEGNGNWFKEYSTEEDIFRKYKFYVFFMLPNILNEKVRFAINKFNGENIDVLRTYISTIFHGADKVCIEKTLKNYLAKINNYDSTTPAKAKALLEAGIKHFIIFDKEVIHQVTAAWLSSEPKKRDVQCAVIKEKLNQALDAYLFQLKLSVEEYEQRREQRMVANAA